jgi:hypothetical protein
MCSLSFNIEENIIIEAFTSLRFVGLVLLIKSLCVLNVAFRVHQNCVYMKIFAAPVLSQLC